MSITFIEGFGTYGNQAGAEQAGWSFSENSTIEAGRFAGTSALKLNGLFDSARRPLSSASQGASEFCVGFAFRLDGSDSSGYNILSFRTLVTPRYQLSLTGAGTLLVRANASGGSSPSAVTYQTLGEGSINLNAVGVWNYIEFRVFDGTSFQVFVNGILDVSGNLLDIFAIRSLVFGHDDVMNNGGTSPNFRLTDMYFKIAGGTFNSDTLPLGDCRVVTKLPDTDVTTQFVPNSGVVNALAVDDVPNDGDSTFVSATNTGTFDAYRSSTPLPFNPQKIHAVSIGLNARKTDAGLRKVGVRVQSAGGTVVNYPGISLGISYQRFEELIERDPDGNSEWTKAKIDSLVFGPRVEV